MRGPSADPDTVPPPVEPAHEPEVVPEPDPDASGPPLEEPVEEELEAVAPEPPRTEQLRPPPQPERAIVRFDGGADGIELAADGQRWAAGEVPAGTYDVVARFDGLEVPAHEGLVLEPGAAVSVSCTAAFQTCDVRW